MYPSLFRVAQYPPLRRKLFQVDMAQQAVFVHSCCTSAWSLFLPEDGCEEGNSPHACGFPICHVDVAVFV